MKARTLGRHFREGGKSLGRNSWMTFASASAVTVTLLLVGVFLVLLLNLNNFASSIEDDVEMKLYIDPSTSQADIQAMQSQIKENRYVESVTFSSKAEELKKLIKSFGDDGSAFKLFEQDNPLSDVYIVKTKEPKYVEKTATQMKELPHVTKVQYGQEEVKKLFKVLKVARNIGAALIIALVLTAMFLISNTIKITIFARKDEIEIMRLVGATNSFIRWPLFLEGLFIGLIGSVIPIILISVSYSFLYDSIKPKVIQSLPFVQLLPTFPFVLQVSAVLAVIGACIGVWGSLISVRKFLYK
ncbi:permease-like cell division protein FtsX [Priestia koreensis]|uniref:permease-like cell division protein FtsX n=1 Tax=Priestia koreensis TaxID=284581 RepID=UPI00203B7BD8|nr:permease-like cell division protein FtsX [Priestia koreensis]MCM3004548.1 permease-like cell division protein FtsX [Priestia koreensis]